jgi:hypothetical protein
MENAIGTYSLFISCVDFLRHRCHRYYFLYLLAMSRSWSQICQPISARKRTAEAFIFAQSLSNCLPLELVR